MSPKAHRQLLEGMEALKLALDPELAADRAEWLERAEKQRYVAGSFRQRTSGWGKKGPPQCPGCRRLLKSRDGWCPSCNPARHG